MSDSPHPPSVGLAYACLALSMALVGSYVALSKPLVGVFGVFILAWLRFAIGAVATLHWLPKPVSEPRLPLRMQALLFLESLLGNFLFSIFMLYGVSMTSALSAGVIMSTIPMVVALLSWGFLKERLSRQTLGALVLAIMGMGLLGLNKSTDIPTTGQATHWLGNALVLGAVVCEAAYAVIGKRLAHVLSPKRITAIINLWGLALMTPLAWASVGDWTPQAVPLPMWLLLLFYGMAASVWTVWLWMTGLQQVPASRAGVFTAVLPVSACLVGWALGETPQPVQWLALALALAGVYLATRPAVTPTA